VRHYSDHELVRVDELQGGETIRGTGPSGPYEDGPRVLERIAEAIPARPTQPEYRLWFTDGRTLIYFGSTQVALLP
jgi:hypothetical protein